MSIYRILAITMLMTLAKPLDAGDLKQIIPLHWTPMLADNAEHSFVWTNTTGFTIYIKRIEVYYPNEPDEYTAVGAVTRNSDGSNLIYLPTEVAEYFGSDYFVLGSGDGLTLSFIYFGNNQPVGIAYWIWYTAGTP
jgi:hypothetical protein